MTIKRISVVSILVAVGAAVFRELRRRRRGRLHRSKGSESAALATVRSHTEATTRRVPYAEELVRRWRAERRGLVGRDTPECARELLSKQTT